MIWNRSPAARRATETHRAIRREILSNPALTGLLRAAAARGAVHYPSVGNTGDGLIQLGTFHLLDDLGLQCPLAKGLTPSALDGANIVVLGGGGGWVDGLYSFWPYLLGPFLERGGEVILLPSSVSGFGEFFRRFGAQFQVFAREATTFDHLRSLPELSGRVHSAHDLAFACDPRFLKRFGTGPSGRNLSLMRTDGESRTQTVPFGNLDIALMVNGIQWAERPECERYLLAAAGLIDQFQDVESDRLHMSALSALLGKSVRMHSNSYFKNEGVYRQTLSRFANVTFAG
jgi:hypothetical protein